MELAASLRLLHMRRDSRGAAVVETAVSLALVLLGMFAAVQFDYTSFQQLQLDEMAQLGARQVATPQNIQNFVSNAAYSIQTGDVAARPAADGHVPLQVVSVSKSNLPSFFGLLSPPQLVSQAAEVQFSQNFPARMRPRTRPRKRTDIPSTHKRRSKPSADIRMTCRAYRRRSREIIRKSGLRRRSHSNFRCWSTRRRCRAKQLFPRTCRP